MCEQRTFVAADERRPSVTYPLQSVPMLTTFSASREVQLCEPIASVMPLDRPVLGYRAPAH
jgi:hypothetical protein